jgi:hypothetical protein
MESSDVEGILDELKYYHLIDPKRKLLEDANVHCTFKAKDPILFNHKTLDFLNKDEVLWILLHEEAHLIFPQKKFNASTYKIIITIILIFVATELIKIFSQNFLPSRQYFTYFLVLLFIFFSAELIIWCVIYIENHYFYKPYWDDEICSDEYAVKGLFIVRPNLIAWQVMQSSFQSLERCKLSSTTKVPFIIAFRRFLKIPDNSHPPNKVRVQNVRELFNKYIIKKHSIC